MKRKLILGSTLVLSLVACGFVFAQPPGPPHGPGGGADGPRSGPDGPPHGPDRGPDGPHGDPPHGPDRGSDGPHGGPPHGPRSGPDGPHGGPPPHDFEPDPEMRAFMEHVMMARLSKELDLDDEQTVLMVRRLADVKEQTEKAKRKRMRLMREIHETASEDRNDPGIGAKLDSLIATDRELIEARFEAFEKASEGLDDWQRARLYVFVQEFDSDMRRLVSRARDRYLEGRGGHGRDKADDSGRPPLRDRDNSDRPPRNDGFGQAPPPEGDGALRPRQPRRGPGGDDRGRPGPPHRRGDGPPPPPPPPGE